MMLILFTYENNNGRFMDWRCFPIYIKFSTWQGHVTSKINNNNYIYIYIYAVKLGLTTKYKIRLLDQDGRFRSVPICLVRNTSIKQCVKDDHLSYMTLNTPNLDQKRPKCYWRQAGHFWAACFATLANIVFGYDGKFWSLDQIWLHFTCSSPRRPLFLHGLLFECTSKLCINFLNQFEVYFHI